VRRLPWRTSKAMSRSVCSPTVLTGHIPVSGSRPRTRAVAEVCIGLEGIPLAIELAAARIGMLSAGQISERLGRSLDLLTQGARTADRRHRTLRATLDWGYELLGGPEQALFGRLSAFAGGFTLEAAESVGGAEELRRSRSWNCSQPLSRSRSWWPRRAGSGGTLQAARAREAVRLGEA
jgi:hypothetical protein